MIEVKTLYHPKFEPKERWLRAMLLFYDTIHSIVPKNAEYVPSPGIAELQDRVPDAFVPLAPTEQDLVYDWDNYYALLDVLRELSSQGKDEGRVRARFDWPDGTPRLDLGGMVKVHYDKMADSLVLDLLELGLAEQTEEPEWLRVDSRVADLVLSMLADRMAKNRSGIIYTSSDRETSFAVAAKSELAHGQSWNMEATLASAILTAEVPADISDLSLDRYVDIRRRYEDKREVFRLAMSELQTLYFQKSFQSPGEFGKRLEAVVTDFGRKTQALREKHLERQVRRWAPVALGGIVSLAAAAIPDPGFNIAAAGVMLTVEALRTAQGERVRGTYIAESQALLVELDRELRWNRNWLSRIFS